MADNPTFSLCMILRNEAKNLSRSLKPIAGLFDEVVVVDTGSEDGTPEIARSYGARVVPIPWPDDFAAARNASIEAARGDWILWLDGDNRMPPQGVETLRQQLDHHRQSVFWCTEVVIPAGERLIQKRVFPRRPEVYFTGRVHEQLTHPPSFKSVLTTVEIFHWGYQDRAGAREKGRRNLVLLERMARENPGDQYVSYQMGKTLLNLRQFEDASQWLARVTADPKGLLRNKSLHLHAHLLLAQATDRLGRIEEAESILKSLLEKEPAYGPGHLALARMDYAAARYDRAVTGFQTFRRLGPGDPLAGLNPAQMHFTAAMLLGKSLTKTGRLKEARRAFQEAEQIKPDDPEPILALAESALAGGEKETARHHAARALERNPRNRRAILLLEECESG